jgi:4'-phosphopantetheinyl transferase EntD
LDDRAGIFPTRILLATDGSPHAELAAMKAVDPTIKIGAVLTTPNNWPDGIVGSITHCPGYCAAAVAPRAQVLGLGIDAEQVTPLDETEIPLICTSAELDGAIKVLGYAHVVAAKLIFSAKESFYKCYYPLIGRFLDFLDVTVSVVDKSHFIIELINSSLPAFFGRRHCMGRFLIHRHHFLTSIALLPHQRTVTHIADQPNNEEIK